MILIDWLKRIRGGSGFCGFSASSWNKVCNVLETIEGIGCTINKTHSGNGWTVVVDGKSSDVPYPEGVTPGGEGSDQFPDGTEIWGKVVYDQTNNKFVQYKHTWNKASKTFVQAETPVDIITAVSHASQH